MRIFVGTEGKFDWERYLQQTGSVGAPADMFDHDNYEDIAAFEVRVYTSF